MFGNLKEALFCMASAFVLCREDENGTEIMTNLLASHIELPDPNVWYDVHWSADCWDCSVECPKNRARSFRSQMVNKQGPI